MVLRLITLIGHINMVIAIIAIAVIAIGWPLASLVTATVMATVGDIGYYAIRHGAGYAVGHCCVG